MSTIMNLVSDVQMHILDYLDKGDLYNALSCSRIFAPDTAYVTDRIFAKHGKHAFAVAARAHTRHDVLHMLVDKQKCDPLEVDPSTGMAAIHYAAMNQDVSLVRYIVRQGEDVDRQGPRGTPLMLAIEASNGALSDTVRYLSIGALETTKDASGNNAIHVAAKMTSAECLSHLLFLNWDPLMTNKNGNNTMMLARSEACITVLCQKMPDIVNTARNSDKVTPLMRAVRLGHVKTGRRLLDHGADPLARDSHGATAVFYIRHKEIVQLFDETSMSTYDNIGNSVLHYYSSANRADLISAVMSSFDLSLYHKSDDNRTALDCAVMNGAYDAAKAILSIAKDKESLLLNRTETQYEYGSMIPLHLAVNRKDSRMVSLLLSACKRCTRMQLNSRVRMTHMDQMPIHMAAKLGSIDVIDVLCSYGADVEAVDALDQTPLYVACSLGNMDLSDHLIHLGADPCSSFMDDLSKMPICGLIESINYNEDLFCKMLQCMPQKALIMTSAEGKTLLHLACEANNVNALGYLVHIVPRFLLNVRCNGNGFTALHSSIESADVECIKLLLSSGADRMLVDAQGRTPLDYVKACKENDDMTSDDYDAIVILPL